MKHKTKGFIAMILALCLMMSLGVGALADDVFDDSGYSGVTPSTSTDGDGSDDEHVDPSELSGDMEDDKTPDESDPGDPPEAPTQYTVSLGYAANIITPNVTYSVEGGESIAVSNGAQIPSGATITVSATAKEGYSVGNITYSIGSNEQSLKNGGTFDLTGNAVIKIHNVKLYKVTCETATGGTVTADKYDAAEGESVTITASPSDLYTLDTLTVDGSTVEATKQNDDTFDYTFTMPASDVTVTATFKATEPDPEPAKYTVSANTGNFTISGTGDYEKDEIVSLTITPNTGYYLYSVRIDGKYKEPGAVGYYTFTMPGHDVSVEVVAKPYSDWRDWHNIDTYSNSVDGGISVVSGALEGSTVTFRVWSNFKYDYNYDYRVYVTNDRTGATVKYDYDAYYDEYSFTMPDDDVTISVYFDHVGDYSITKDVEGDGSIYVQSSADYDEPVWITVKPDSGQSLTSLRVFRENYGWYQTSDGKWHGYGKAEVDVEYSKYYDAYYFYMPADDVVVYARFTDGATVTVTSGDHGSAKVSSRYAEKGDWVYITAYPDDGYEVADVTVVDRLGKSVKVTELSSDYFLFTMPGTSVDVKVTFREVDYGYFYDVSRGDWYYEAVRYVYEKGIMEGTSAHYFSPNADLSRGMLATILYRLEGSPNVSGYSSFNDVADTSYYAKAIAWAERNGIVNGVTTERFEPDTAVTREQMAAILCRYADYKGHDTSVSYDYLATFGDSGSSHVYARPALNWAVAHRIINGQGSSVLAPRATATRAEVAQVLMNYLEAYD